MDSAMFSHAPGKLIVFEGIDGTGKSTQIRLLKAWLEQRGFGVACDFEPTRGPWGMKVRQAAANGERLSIEEEIECLLEDRREHVRHFIEPHLSAGDWVLLDRYYPSMMAYQGASGCNVEALREMNEAFAPVPDLAFWLDIPLETALDRMEQRGLARDAFEKEDFLQRCRDIYSGMDMPWFHRIAATGEQEQTHEAVLRLVAEELFEAVGE